MLGAALGSEVTPAKIKRKEGVRDVQLLLVLFEVNYGRRTLIARGDGGHVFQHTGHLLQLRDLRGGHLANSGAKIFILQAYQPWLEVRECVQHEFIDVNTRPVLQFALFTVCPLPRTASKLLEDRTSDRVSNASEYYFEFCVRERQLVLT